MDDMLDTQFLPALPEEELATSGHATFILNGWHVLLVRVGDAIHALNDRCSHAASPLSTGRFRHGSVMCAMHGARFDLASGQCIGGAYRAVRKFPVRIDDGWIKVAVPIAPPGLPECPVVPG